MTTKTHKTSKVLHTHTHTHTHSVVLNAYENQGIIVSKENKIRKLIIRPVDKGKTLSAGFLRLKIINNNKV